MRVKIEKIVYPGKSIARHKGKVVFLDEGLPQEEVQIKILKEKKDFLEAQVVEVISKSLFRKIPLCEHFKICSRLQYIEYDYQLEIKKMYFKEIFLKTLKRDLEVEEFVGSQLKFRYRNKGLFSVVYEKENPFCAYHAPYAPKNFVKIDECFLFSERANKIFKEVLKEIKTNNLKSVKNIEIRESFSQKEILVNIYFASRKEFEKINTLNITADNILASFTLTKIGPPKSLDCRILKGREFLEEKISEFYFRINTFSFFQINSLLLKELLNHLIENSDLTGKEKIADFYCGIGTLSIPIAKKAKEIFGIEFELPAIIDLKHNLIKNGIYNYTIAKGRTEDFCDYILSKDIDLLILDPPRTGLNPKVLKSILKHFPKRIFYISCDLATLSRDLKILDSKYKIRKGFGYDFFAQTPYIESFVILEKKI